MFVTYLRRELRRRMRQAIFIALGLALGIGLVITVTAASAGVSSTQGTVLHSLYGVGTDVTVTQAPAAGSGGPARFGFGGGNSGRRPAAGTSFSRSILTSGGLGDAEVLSGHADSRPEGRVRDGRRAEPDRPEAVRHHPDRAAPARRRGTGGQPGGGGNSTIKTSTFSVTGVNLATGSLGPLSSGDDHLGPQLQPGRRHRQRRRGERQLRQGGRT